MKSALSGSHGVISTLTSTRLDWFARPAITALGGCLPFRPAGTPKRRPRWNSCFGRTAAVLVYADTAPAPHAAIVCSTAGRRPHQLLNEQSPTFLDDLTAAVKALVA